MQAGGPGFYLQHSGFKKQGGKREIICVCEADSMFLQSQHCEGHSQIDELLDQWETLSQKERWRMTEDESGCCPLAYVHAHAHTHAHHSI